MKSYQREQLDNYFSELEINGDRILDIGGGQSPIYWKDGTTEYSKFKTCKCNIFDVLDVENPIYLEQSFLENTSEEAKNKLVHSPTILFDMNNSTNTLSFNEKTIVGKGYDIVFCIAMNIFIWNTVQFVKNLNYFTKLNGVLYITNYFIQPVVKPIDADILRLTRNGIIKLLDIGGFEIEDIKPLNAKNEGITKMYDGQLMRYAKGYEYHNEVGQFIKAKKVIDL
jgi:hypothetical protein